MVEKTNESRFSETLAVVVSGDLLIVFSTEVNLPYRLYLMALRCYLVHLTKQNHLLKTFLKLKS